MTDPIVVLTPLLVLLILALFRFTGCKPFSGTDPVGKVEGPPLTGNVPSPPPTSPPTYEQVVTTTPGFAAYWPLDEAAGNQLKANSALVPSVHGSLEYVAGIPPSAGKLGVDSVALKDSKINRAPQFDGTGAYVKVDFNQSLNPGATLKFSVALWVKPNLSAGPATQVVVSSVRVDTKSGYDIALIRTGPLQHPQVRARVLSSANPITVLTTQNLTGGNPDDWRYIVLTYSGGAVASAPGTLTLWVGIVKVPGLFRESTNLAHYENVAAATPATLQFGAGHGSGQRPNNFFAGQLDEVAFYNSVLREDEDIKRQFGMAS